MSFAYALHQRSDPKKERRLSFYILVDNHIRYTALGTKSGSQKHERC